ncbi:MAG: DUF4160 domain-containing protein [Planctomycetota bacterium]|nr:DUF4160 domain-containing protein [Planctomycetota bacterium]
MADIKELRRELFLLPRSYTTPETDLDNRYHVWYRFSVPKIRRGGYIFFTWIGDHAPRHVHVYRDRKLVVKWDLENMSPMKGEASRRVLKLIAELDSEDLL